MTLQNSKKVLVFGASGQDGFYLIKFLTSLGIDVIGFSRKPGFRNVEYTNFDFIKSILLSEKPTHIFHLAANSSTKHDLLFENFEIIDRFSLYLLEAIKLVSPATKLFLSGSALQFKNIGLPINEVSVFESSSPYVVSRINTTYMARYFRDKYGLMIYTGFFFHHDSPLRNSQHINKIIVDGAISISKGIQDQLNIGNIEVEKEFNFAGDFIKAIWTLVNQENIFEAVIGCGISYKIKDWIKICFENLDLDYTKYIKTDSNYKPLYLKTVSNPSLIKSLGWEPRYNIEDLATIMINNNLDKI